MAALHAEVPALRFAHDNRTTELVDHLRLPSIRLGSVGDKTLAELYASADYSNFNRSYEQRYDAYRSFLDENGVINRLRPRPAAPVFQMGRSDHSNSAYHSP